MYRVYIAENGLYNDKNKHYIDNIEDVFSLIDKSTRETNEYTKYLVIDTTGGDYPILLFYNDKEDKIMGLDYYEEIKQKYIGGARVKRR